MPNFTKLLGAAAVLALVAGAALAEGDAPAPMPSPDTVVATVDGTEITLGMMAAVRNNLPSEYQQLPDDILFNGVLEQLIQQTALAKVGEGMVTHKDEVAMEVERRAYLAGMLLDYTADRAVNPERLKAAYDSKFAKAEPSREFRASHILVTDEAEAQKIKAEIDAGADFGAVAQANSIDASSANGGDLGWFTLDVMVKPFGDAVAGMKAGEVAGPVETEYGWHVIKLTETRLTAAPTLEEATAELTGDIRQKAVEDRVKETVEKAKVEKHVEGIDPSVLKNPNLFGDK